ncbi:MAG: helix-turn-helix domain-containing protein [Ignavibacteriales bacterium]|nr:helix-turn-helix domain-containing protein [Ignavibacteriales bacterium]
MGKQFDEVLTKLTKIEELLGAQQPAPFTLAEAAVYLHCSRQTLYRLTSQSEIVHYKPNGKRLYFLKGDLDAWLTRNRVREVER